MTRSTFCYVCRDERLFYRSAHGATLPNNHGAWTCPVCGIHRHLTIDVLERNLDGKAAQFWGNVKVTPFCWPWITPVKKGNDARFSIDGISHQAARVAFLFAHGKYPDGTAFRTCSNEMCMKPDHIIDLPISKMSETLSKMGRLKNIKHKPRQFCRRRHRLVGHNAGKQKGGMYCRKCKNAKRLERYHLKRNMLAMSASEKL